MAVVSLLAQVADLKASQAAGAASSVMPSGVILPYGGATAPAGWLECNGQAVSQTDYADLFAALGSAYNTQLNPTTGANWAAPSAGQFRVPDMRGMFLRGEGTPSGLDAVSVGGSQVDKTKKNGLSNTGSAVSGTTNIAHTHSSSYVYCSKSSARTGGTSQAWGPGKDIYMEYGITNVYEFIAIDGSANGQSLGATSPALASGSAAAQVISGDNETRPINRGVKYIIKV